MGDSRATLRRGNSATIRHLLKRRRMIIRRNALLRLLVCALFVVIPLSMAILVIQSSGSPARPAWHVALYCVLFACLTLGPLGLYLSGELREWRTAPGLRSALRTDLLERGLLQQVLDWPDPRELLDPQRLQAEGAAASLPRQLPPDAAARLDFLVLNFRGLCWSRMQARRGKPGGRAEYPAGMQRLKSGEAVCLIEVLVAILGELNA